MKVKVTKKELKECLTNAVTRALNEAKSFKNKNGFEKATKSANREIERDTFGDGFKSYDKVHKSAKDYSRKGKNKFNKHNYEELDEAIIDFNSPDDENYYDDGYEIEAPEVTDIIGGEEYDDDPQITIKTDLDKNEHELIQMILGNFDYADRDIVDGSISFTIPKSKRSKFIGFLRDNDINIIK